MVRSQKKKKKKSVRHRQHTEPYRVLPEGEEGRRESWGQKVSKTSLDGKKQKHGALRPLRIGLELLRAWCFWGGSSLAQRAEGKEFGKGGYEGTGCGSCSETHTRFGQQTVDHRKQTCEGFTFFSDDGKILFSPLPLKTLKKELSVPATYQKADSFQKMSSHSIRLLRLNKQIMNFSLEIICRQL